MSITFVVYISQMNLPTLRKYLIHIATAAKLVRIMTKRLIYTVRILKASVVKVIRILVSRNANKRIECTTIMLTGITSQDL